MNPKFSLIALLGMVATLALAMPVTTPASLEREKRWCVCVCAGCKRDCKACDGSRSCKYQCLYLQPRAILRVEQVADQRLAVRLQTISTGQ